ncbi:hypothetical protein K503DRAFT_129288 [Rhizopogon vinicolor AM-OR11-026]|uniref:Uncharacterized protein n=1 Tax=Rhizopogon vinicolor AM-OR11-026 TaxID=1314800 RepID=A0A1B7N1Z7_9AGAM|nr:hypothetical protein K503DRAFT_129288 [Rhizopogon vinicolor AM-OR11-026]
MDQHIWQYTKKIIEHLVIRHFDLSLGYYQQPRGQLEFLKIEVLLRKDMSHLLRYPDGWAVEAFVRILFQRHSKLLHHQKPALPGAQSNRAPLFAPTSLQLSEITRLPRMLRRPPKVLQLISYSVTIRIKCNLLTVFALICLQSSERTRLFSLR